VLLSRDFAEQVAPKFELEHVGKYEVRGFSDPIELFAFQSGAKT
jgi:adenylate cyclase